jgi:hypothetical protein
MNGVPARDLYPADLIELERRERITPEMIAASPLYKADDLVEVEPFCGAPTASGRCKASVLVWGMRCAAHSADSEALRGSLLEIRGVGPETEAILRELEVKDVDELAKMDDDQLHELAELIPRVSVRMLFDWREQARRLRWD